MRIQLIYLLAAFAVCCNPGSNKTKGLTDKGSKAPTAIDSSTVIRGLKFLSSDTCEGRQPGSVGHEAAALRMLTDLRLAKTDSFSNGFIQAFAGKSIHGYTGGKNILGWVKGKDHPGIFIIITAHYDHLGKAQDGSIYYGADDNASGAACLMALAKYFAANTPSCSLLFVAFDREETGLEGATYFVNHLPAGVTKNNILLNLNLDMIARADKNELYVCGLKHWPAFSAAVHSIQSKTCVRLLTGHDTGSDDEDWTSQSDHYAFHKAAIPFLYIGVENHPDYHHTSDTFDKIDLSKYLENCNMIVLLVKALQATII